MSIYLTSPQSLTRDLGPALARPAHMGPLHPGPDTDPADLCQFWQDMDAHYGTGTDSPLHHDTRCARHRPHACQSQCDLCHTQENCVPATRRYEDLTVCDSCYRHSVTVHGAPAPVRYDY